MFANVERWRWVKTVRPVLGGMVTLRLVHDGMFTRYLALAVQPLGLLYNWYRVLLLWLIDRFVFSCSSLHKRYRNI